MCLLAGYLAGAVLGPDAPERTTATVSSYTPSSGRLCLTGDGVAGNPATDESGELCGTWSHSAGATKPTKGDTFRFVTMTAEPDRRAPREKVVIYGTVVGD